MKAWRNLLVLACVSTLALVSAAESKNVAGREDSEQTRVSEREMMAKLGRDMSRNLRSKSGKDARFQKEEAKPLKHARKAEQSKSVHQAPHADQHVTNMAHMQHVVSEFSKLGQRSSPGAVHHPQRASELRGAGGAQQNLSERRERSKMPAKINSHQESMHMIAREFSQNLKSKAHAPQQSAPLKAGSEQRAHAIKGANHMKRSTGHPQEFQKKHIQATTQNLSQSMHKMLAVPKKNGHAKDDGED